MKPTSPAQHFPAADHDHASCQAEVVERAAQAFERQGLRLTELRRLVLEEVAASHKAIGAYEVLDRLARRGGRRLAPISVYRALDTLVDAGVVHRLESRNAFFACHAPHGRTQGRIVFACEGCGAVAEVARPGIFAEIEKAAVPLAFEIRRTLVEVSGACERCAAEMRQAE